MTAIRGTRLARVSFVSGSDGDPVDLMTLYLWTATVQPTSADAHVMCHDDEPEDRRCWKTLTGSDYLRCGRDATTPVGLCDDHHAELTSGDDAA